MTIPSLDGGDVAALLGIVASFFGIASACFGWRAGARTRDDEQAILAASLIADLEVKVAAAKDPSGAAPPAVGSADEAVKDLALRVIRAGHANTRDLRAAGWLLGAAFLFLVAQSVVTLAG